MGDMAFLNSDLRTSSLVKSSWIKSVTIINTEGWSAKRAIVMVLGESYLQRLLLRVRDWMGLGDGVYVTVETRKWLKMTLRMMKIIRKEGIKVMEQTLVWIMGVGSEEGMAWKSKVNSSGYCVQSPRKEWWEMEIKRFCIGEDPVFLKFLK